VRYGSRTQSANYLLDGSENNDTSMSAPAQDVPLDSIEEFILGAIEIGLDIRKSALIP
jgi:hypothetical protein